MSRNQVYSIICFGVALFLSLFASVERIRLAGEAPGELTNQKALEVANGRGLLPVLANIDTAQHIDISQEAGGSYLIRYVSVAYMGNILIMVIFFFTGLLLRTSFIEKITG